SAKRLRDLRRPFEQLLTGQDGFIDVSPDAIRTLNERAASDPEVGRIIENAVTPAPLRPPLTRALVDAWSMTSLEEHTGRPDVEPWLRGWVREHPHTTVIWRTHLPVRQSDYVSAKEVEAFFEAAPPYTIEQLETETYRAVEWLVDRAAQIFKDDKR